MIGALASRFALTSLLSIALTLLLVSTSTSSACATTDEYRFEPADFTGGLPPSIQGPEKTIGAAIWNHGRDNLHGSSQYPAPAIALYFSQSGWDIFALLRIAFSNRPNELRAQLNMAVDALKQKGYRRILLMGQSAGAWGSIEVGGSRDDIEGVIALVPAAGGNEPNRF